MYSLFALDTCIPLFSKASLRSSSSTSNTSFSIVHSTTSSANIVCQGASFLVLPSVNLYINLRRSRDCLLLWNWMFGWVGRCLCVSDSRFIQLVLGSCYAVHKRIVNIIKVYIESNSMHVELMRFRKQIAFIHVCFCDASNFPTDAMFMQRVRWVCVINRSRCETDESA